MESLIIFLLANIARGLPAGRNFKYDYSSLVRLPPIIFPYLSLADPTSLSFYYMDIVPLEVLIIFLLANIARGLSPGRNGEFQKRL